MPRTARKRSEGDVYHVTVRGEGRRILFEDDEDRETFLRMLSKALDNCGGEAYAWCLMSNHVHLLMHVAFEKLPRLMQGITSGYAVYYNGRHDHVGHVFAGRFGSEPVNDDRYLLAVVRYIHANPVKGGLSSALDYRWSSYGDYLSGKGFTSTGFVLDVVGGLERFVSLHSLSESDEGSDAATPVKTPGRRRLGDDEALEVARETVGASVLRNLSSLPRSDRDEGIAALRCAGLTARQIERLTGIGRGVINRVEWR